MATGLRYHLSANGPAVSAAQSDESRRYTAAEESRRHAATEETRRQAAAEES